MRKHATRKLIAGLSSACIALTALPFAGMAASAAEAVYGDVNLDGKVTLADSLAILQFIANEEKYALNDQQKDNADVFNRGDGITAMDSMSIQKYDTGLITKLPESWKDQPADPAAEGTKIHLSGTAITVEGDNATVNGTTVTITHSGSFYIDGTLDDGQICVNIPDEAADPDTVKIYLNGVKITGKSAPAILVNNAENTSINIADGTENTISDGDTAYAGDSLGAAVIEAKDDLTIKGGEAGTGILNITANTQTAISCNNDIKVNGGVINVTTLNSTDKTDGIKAKKSLTVKDGTLTIDTEGDGIKSSKDAVAITGGSVTIKAGNDAIQAETTIDISGGKVMAGGDRGLTAAGGVNITGGTVIATATDNQADSTKITSASQPVILLNCKADATNEKDGTWKKSNTLEWKSMNGSAQTMKAEFTKKFKYILISSESIKAGTTHFTNTNAGKWITHTNDEESLFAVSNGVNVFENVNLAGAAAGVNVPPSAEPTVTTEGLAITLGANMTTNAPAEVAAISNNVCTIKQPGVFTVTGGMNGGQIVVDVDKTVYPDGVVELDLSGMSLTNTADSPIYVASIGDEVVIVSKNGTENTITDGTGYTNADSDTGAIYSKDDLKFKGKGTLTVNGKAGDAIVSKDDIKIYNGNLIVNAADDGIRGKDSVTIGNTSSDGTEVDYSNLSVKVTTDAGDGIKATATDGTTTAKQCGIVTINCGTVNIDSYADGIQAEQFFEMDGGEVTIKTYEGSTFTGTGSTGNTGGNTGWGGFGGRGGMGGFGMDGNANKTDISAKGIKAVGVYSADGTTWQSYGDIDITGGTLTIDSSDDCLHSGGDMDLTGGELKLSSADDGAHSDHKLTIGSGTADTFDDIQIIISKAYEGIEGQQIYQNSGTVIVNSTDDAYNAAGGDGSGAMAPGMPWGQGNMGTSGNNYELVFNGGFALANVTDGDHDGFDSNGNITINGGYVITNGNEPFDCGDSGNTNTYKGGVFVENTGSGGMQMGASMTANVAATGSVSAGTRITLCDSNNNVIVSFIAKKNVSNVKAGVPNSAGVTVYTGGTLSGSTYFQTIDETQLAAYGGTLTGGTALAAGSTSTGGNTGRPGRGF